MAVVVLSFVATGCRVVVRQSVSPTGVAADASTPSVSADGRFVAFTAPLSTLHALPPGTVDPPQVFVRDRQLATTTLASSTSTGAAADRGATEGVISADGGHVTFSSSSRNLDGSASCEVFKGVFVKDLATGVVERVSVAPSGAAVRGQVGSESLSGDGRFVVFRADSVDLPGTHGDRVYLRDRLHNTTEWISDPSAMPGVLSGVTGYRARISADGRFVVFDSEGATPGHGWRVFLRNVEAHTTRLVSAGVNGAHEDGSSDSADIDSTGRYLVFSSTSTNLVAPALPPQIPFDVRYRTFRQDTSTGVTELVSIGLANVVPDASTFEPSISGDGFTVAFSSQAHNLVTGVATNVPQVYVRDLRHSTTTRVSVAPDGTPGNGAGDHPDLSGDGVVVAFDSSATNIGTPAVGSGAQVYASIRVL